MLQWQMQNACWDVIQSVAVKLQHCIETKARCQRKGQDLLSLVMSRYRVALVKGLGALA